MIEFVLHFLTASWWRQTRSCLIIMTSRGPLRPWCSSCTSERHHHSAQRNLIIISKKRLQSRIRNKTIIFFMFEKTPTLWCAWSLTMRCCCCTTRPRAGKKPRLRVALFDIVENQQDVFLLLRHTQERLLLIQLCIQKIDFYASL